MVRGTGCNFFLASWFYSLTDPSLVPGSCERDTYRSLLRREADASCLKHNRCLGLFLRLLVLCNHILPHSRMFF